MLKSAGFTLITRLITAVLNFLSVIIISRFLGPAERGVCGWYLVIVATTLVFSELVAGPAAGFLLRKYREGMVRKLSYAWAVVPVLIINSLFFLINKVSWQEWGLLIVICWLNAANTIHLHLLLARQRFFLFNTLTIFISAAALLSIVIIFETGKASAIAYLAGLMAAWSIAFVAGIFFFRKPVDVDSKVAGYRILLKEGFTFGIANQAGHLTSLLNSRLVFFMLPAGMLGVYSNALSLSEAMMMIPGSMGQVLYASVLNEKDESRSAVTAKAVWWLTFIILAFCYCIILLIPDSFYQFIFGSEFTGVKNYLLVLALGTVFYGSYLVLSYWQSANGKFINNFYATSIGLIINVLLSVGFFMNDKLDPVNAAICMAISFGVIFLVSVLQFAGSKGFPKRLFPPPSLPQLQELVRK